MKKIFSVIASILCFVFMLALAACGSDGTIPPIKADDDRPTHDGTKTLVVYFSQPDNVDNSTVVIGGKTMGNTQYMAYVIQDNTNANIFRILPETPYPTDHDELVDQARDEQRRNSRPKIKGTIADFEIYGTVFVGYPNWWSDMPMIMYTFFDTYDFSGKTIIPFNTHGGSGFSGTIATIRGLEPNATVLDGKSISRDRIQDAEQEIIDWIDGLDLTQTPDDGDDNDDGNDDNGSDSDDDSNSDDNLPPSSDTDSDNILIAYFSWSGTTTRLAEHVKAQIPSATLYKIERETPYSNDYNTVANGEAKDEADNNARPPVKDPLSALQMSEYGTIIVMYPIWWHTAPMVVGTFLETYDLSGVDIYPITQSASMSTSQFEQSFAFVEECASKKGTPVVHEGLGTKSTSTIDSYLRGNGLIA